MKKIFISLALMFSIVSQAVVYHGFESWQDFAYEHNSAFGPLALKYQLGTLLSEARTAVGVYDFSKTGGHRVDDAGVGSRGNADHYTGITLPQNSMIRNVVLWVNQGLAPGNARFSLRYTGAADLYPLTAASTVSTGAILQGTPDDTVANMIVSNSAHRINAVIASADATAGRIYIYVDYVTKF